MPGKGEPPKPENVHILAVDDDPSTLEILRFWLGDVGFQVRLASCAKEALQQIVRETPDVIITDWRMPGMSGIDLCRKIRSMPLPSYVYILLLTARSQPEDLVEGLDAGADDFLAKPVLRSELIARLQAGLRIIGLEASLSEQARTDALTGLLNRTTFYETLQREYRRARFEGLPMSCAMLDIDFFKRVNDMHGHVVGDEVLRGVAKMLCASVRASDIVCRFGGEEFFVILPDTTERAALTWAERTRRQIADTPIDSAAGPVTLTVSFGVVQLDDCMAGADQLVASADEAMLRAKKRGRNCVVLHSSLPKGMLPSVMDTREVPPLEDDLPASEVMLPIHWSLHEATPLREAMTLFCKHRAQAVPVIDGHGFFVDLMTDDALLHIAETTSNWERPIRDFVKAADVCFEEATPLSVIHKFLLRVGKSQVVIAHEKTPVGLIDTLVILDVLRNPRVFAEGKVRSGGTSVIRDISPSGDDEVGRGS